MFKHDEIQMTFILGHKAHILRHQIQPRVSFLSYFYSRPFVPKSELKA